MFIGPVLVGKSTVGKIVAEQLGVAHVDIDTVAEDRYYAESGIDLARYLGLEKTDGPLAAFRYAETCFPYVVEHALADHSNCVFSFGAGHSCVFDAELQSRIDAALAPFENVFFLLPSPDVDTSVAVLRERSAPRQPHAWILDGFDCIHFWIASPANRNLSRQTIYTADRTPEDVAAQVLAALS